MLWFRRTVRLGGPGAGRPRFAGLQGFGRSVREAEGGGIGAQHLAERTEQTSCGEAAIKAAISGSVSGKCWIRLP